jgi:hypothetical protein
MITWLRLTVSFVLWMMLVGFRAQPDPGATLRVVTYNTHLFSPAMLCAGGFDAEGYLVAGGLLASGATIESIVVALGVTTIEAIELTECVAEAWNTSANDAVIFAERILRQNDEVMIFNEVFDESAKDVLVNLLSPTFPHYVRVFKDSPGLEDSGLMLFSRYPFASLPNTTYQSPVDATTDQVAFIPYSECEDDDCLSDKGIGLVRIENPYTGMVYTVTFTHMQADYTHPTQYETVRRKQMDTVIQILEGTLGTFWNSSGPVILAGDLNVANATGAVWSLPAQTTISGTGEWLMLSEGLWREKELVDAWAATTSPDDPGITNPDSQQRLDFFVVNQSSLIEAQCVQHMTQPNLGLSDHIAVRANFNRWGPICSPRTAWFNPPFDTLLNEQNPGEGDMTQIARPGMMQWFHIRLRGPETVSIGFPNLYDPATGNGVDFEVYAIHNLTTPIPPYLNETFRLPASELMGRKFVTPREFYIRVFSPNPLWTGDYMMQIHQHTCATVEDACILQVNNPRTQRNLFQANTPLGADDIAWFQIDVNNVADSGAAQSLRFFIDDAAADALSVEWLDKADPSQPFLWTTPAFNRTPTLQELRSDEVGPFGVYMRVQRNDVTQRVIFRAGWETNLTRLHGDSLALAGARELRLTCLDETNGFLGNEMGSDEIHLLINVDHTGWREVFYADYDCNNVAMAKSVESALGVIRFLQQVEVKLVEEDGSINPDDPGPVAVITPLDVQTFPPSERLDPTQDIRVQTNHLQWDFEGGSYRLDYNLSHPIN